MQRWMGFGEFLFKEGFIYMNGCSYEYRELLVNSKSNFGFKL